MLTHEQVVQYQTESISRAMCAGCNKRLSPDETYACAECVNEWLVYRDPNGDMANEDIQEQ
ncbi:protein NinF [Salmonella enterica]|uniref:protein NinF n=1 Tax=Salmonella enterica TaxID=28901 RepID=UPI0009B095BB|nr:protein NinF [Salmonella enterica]EAS0628071.1 NinF family protein [Salmonella enterica subsp. enterica serovar Amager]EBG0717667.1 NinF family protein [Salmonella enterica subsp. enterica serovar Bredeney]EGE9388613.1 NinF family protein [Salmonella enterica subsp. enterica serovar Bredeney]EIQ2747346.1 NinF family protein [Salmonella enterica]